MSIALALSLMFGGTLAGLAVGAAVGLYVGIAARRATATIHVMHPQPSLAAETKAVPTLPDDRTIVIVARDGKYAGSYARILWAKVEEAAIMDPSWLLTDVAFMTESEAIKRDYAWSGKTVALRASEMMLRTVA